MNFIKQFKDITSDDIGQVGGKNASLGEMMCHLAGKEIMIPDGFAITAAAYWHYLDDNKLREPIKQALEQLTHPDDIKQLHKVGTHIRTLIERGTMPPDLADAIAQAYTRLSAQYHHTAVDVAVRSSATAEDLPGASFAGQQETYLNIKGIPELLEHSKRCFASLFTDRALAYRITKGFDHFKVALSIGVQKMVRSDKACSGVAFSLDTETGFKDVIIINASWGLGELIVQGEVVPDEYSVHKPTLEKGYASLVNKKLGDKQIKMVYTNSSRNPVKKIATTQHEKITFCLSDQEIVDLARRVLAIEAYYSQRSGSWCPMDVEWAKDGDDGKLYIVQARPETVHAQHHDAVTQYQLKPGNYQLLGTGQAIGQKISSGPARVIASVKNLDQVKQGDIIVTRMTDPSWVPVMKRAAGIITEQGGRTCHAAIVSRELGIPALVGVADAMEHIPSHQEITLDCSRGSTGYIYSGAIPYETLTYTLDTIPRIPAKILVNTADPAQAYALSFLPVDGVGLARIEFIITTMIGIHPQAIVHPERITDKQIRTKIERAAVGYSDPQTFFVDTLTQGIATIAAAFYPKKVIVRLSDLKSNEYRDLLGGSYFEPEEENPMLGWRGASRYIHPDYKDAFALECAAFKQARTNKGLTNIAIMVPFVRTVDEAQAVLQALEAQGLKRGGDGLEIIMMVEIPENVLLIAEFAKLFDGFSIGSNDLTQLTLGVDRDSALLQEQFDERDPAVKMMLGMAVEGAKKAGTPIGICGQAPSDYPELAAWLIAQGISSLSLNADAVLPFLMRYTKK